MRRAGLGGLRRRVTAHPLAHSRRRTPVSAREETRISSFRTLMTAEEKLPRIGTFRSDLAARKRVQLATLRSGSPAKDGIAANAPDLLERVFLTNVKVWADEKALGLTACMGARPRKPIGG